MTSEIPKGLGARMVRTLPAVLLALVLFSACENRQDGMKDGFYTAEAAEFDKYGWKEYITIYVSGDTIITVDYNAKNASGFIKSWDMEYMRLMNASDGTYPNKYTREYSAGLLNRQDPDKVDVIAGASHSHASFQRLAKAAIARSRAGDQNVAFEDLRGVSGE
ncbi:FMN-binding protein [Treponema sp. OttesenSCG-928-L16]|nr:FMN-binding protein [Treponema sp. OttesenSCG-928-L16]